MAYEQNKRRSQSIKSKISEQKKNFSCIFVYTSKFNRFFHIYIYTNRILAAVKLL